MSRKSPEARLGEDFIELLKTMDHEEVLQVLSGGFCQHCQALLETRIHNLINGKIEIPTNVFFSFSSFFVLFNVFPF